MSNIIYHASEPESRQDTYTEFDNVDFVINVGEGRSLVANSVRLVGELLITADNATGGVLPTTDNPIFLDNKIGIHAVVDSTQVTFNGQGGGIKENIQNYARWVAMTSMATQNENDYMNASSVCELRCPNPNHAAIISQGIQTPSTGDATNHNDRMDFSMRPLNVLNKMSGDNLPYEKSGEIRLTFNLAKNISALMGRGQTLQSGYHLYKLRVTYRSLPTMTNWQKTKTMMRSVYNIKSTIISAAENVSVQVPAVCDAVSCSFQAQNTENVPIRNNYECSKLQDITRLQFLFQDSTSKYITYEMSDLNEIVKRYIESFADTGHSQLYLDGFRKNQFGIGLNFNGFMDLSNQRFGIQLDSGASNNTPYNLYSYFHSLIQC